MEHRRELPRSPSAQRRCFRSIRDFLDRNNADYQTIHHEETRTSEESARVRGVPLSAGGKALLLKVGGDGDDDDNATSKVSLFVMSASRKLDSKAIKKEMKRRGGGKPIKSIRFVTVDELAKITGGLVPGCVPPFGKPILKSVTDPDANGNECQHDDGAAYIELFVDTSIAEENESIAFNAGSLTDSIVMSVPEYLRVSAPTGVFNFSKTT